MNDDFEIKSMMEHRKLPRSLSDALSHILQKLALKESCRVCANPEVRTWWALRPTYIETEGFCFMVPAGYQVRALPCLFTTLPILSVEGAVCV